MTKRIAKKIVRNVVVDYICNYTDKQFYTAKAILAKEWYKSLRLRKHLTKGHRIGRWDESHPDDLPF